MTALVGEEVDETVSTVGRLWTGLPCVETHEAEGQELAEFSERLVWGHLLWCKGHLDTLHLT